MVLPQISVTEICIGTVTLPSVTSAGALFTAVIVVPETTPSAVTFWKYLVASKASANAITTPLAAIRESTVTVPVVSVAPLCSENAILAL